MHEQILCDLQHEEYASIIDNFDKEVWEKDLIHEQILKDLDNFRNK